LEDLDRGLDRGTAVSRRLGGSENEDRGGKELGDVQVIGEEVDLFNPVGWVGFIFAEGWMSGRSAPYP